MGDDAEYYIEQQEGEARFKQTCEYAALDRNRKPLLCWADGVGYEDEIWSWEPLNKILGIFSNLHRERQIGIDCFLASSVPIEGDEEDWDNEYASPLETDDLREIKFVDELEFCMANGEADATHEVIVLSRCDADMLRGEVVRQKSSAKTLKEKMLARDAWKRWLKSSRLTHSVVRLFLQENCEKHLTLRSADFFRNRQFLTPIQRTSSLTR